MEQKTILVTGGAGFIGSAVVRHLINYTQHRVVNVDKLTYAGNLSSLESIANSERYFFEKVDICDAAAIHQLFDKYAPDVVMHLAAESHVDRSIDGPGDFIQTNIVGTYTLLEAARAHWGRLLENAHSASSNVAVNELSNDTSQLQSKPNFRFHHISTDEVYGDLEGTDDLFTESTSYAPSSPYSASKASSDHLVRAWHRTYGLPVVITNCSNNYGPYHFPEKLIPLVILNAIAGKSLPVYGDGAQIRDWLYVEDHADALVHVALNGADGETYNIGGHNEKRNIDVVNAICNALETLRPNKPEGINNYADLITFVKDRPGHDVRYAIDASKIANELGWKPKQTFESGLMQTVRWYLDNEAWWKAVQDGSYQSSAHADKG